MSLPSREEGIRLANYYLSHPVETFKSLFLGFSSGILLYKIDILFFKYFHSKPEQKAVRFMRSARRIHPLFRHIDFISKVIAFPLAEEYFFRGIIRDAQYDFQNRNWKHEQSSSSTCFQTLFNAGFFSLYHFKWKRGLYTNFHCCASAFVAGALFFRLAEETNDLAAPSASHSTLNFFIYRTIKRHQ